MCGSARAFVLTALWVGLSGCALADGVPPVSRGYLARTSRGPHPGIDIRVPTGHEVLAAADGVVMSAAVSGDQGFRVEISHGADEQGRLVRTIYYHMSAALVREGQEVKRGDLIAKAGATGLTPGMHYGVAVGPRRLDHVDPESYWLGGKPQCFKPGESYPALKTRFTYPVRC